MPIPPDAVLVAEMVIVVIPDAKAVVAVRVFLF